MTTLLAMAWRNVWRHRLRSTLTAMAMVIGVAVCMMVLALTDGMFEMMRDVAITQNVGHVQVHHADYPGERHTLDGLDDAAAVMSELDALPTTEAVTARVYGNALLGGPDQTTGAQLVGVLPARERGINELHDKVSEGRWLDDAADGGIVLGVGLADDLDVGLDDEVVAVTQAGDGSLGNALYTVRGMIRSGVPSLDRRGAFLHADDLADLLAIDGMVHEITVVGASHDDEAIAALADEVASTVTGDVVVRPWWEIDPSLAQLFQMQDVSSLMILFVVFGVAALGVMSTMLMSVLERTREFGVLRSLGVRPAELVLLVVSEALILATLATIVGAALGGVGDWYLVTQGLDMAPGGEGFELESMSFDPVIHGKVTVSSVVQLVVGVFFFSVGAALWPALRAARLRPVDALRAE